MYLEPAGDRLRFGDLIIADWLYDIYLRPDAVSLNPGPLVNGKVQMFTVRGVAPRAEPPPGRDTVAVQADLATEWTLAFGGQRAAIVLTDDCELETLYGREVDGEPKRDPRGRILLAGVRDATEAQIANIKGNVSNFGLPPNAAAPVVKPLIADLGRTFTVHTKSLLANSTYTRVASLDDDAKTSLSTRWDAYAARHGPLIAGQMSLTMAKLFQADGDATKTAALRPIAAIPDDEWKLVSSGVAAALTSAWMLEGPIGDRMLAAWEYGRPVGDLRDQAIAALLSVRAGADAALSGLGEPSWASVEQAHAGDSADE